MLALLLAVATLLPLVLQPTAAQPSDLAVLPAAVLPIEELELAERRFSFAHNGTRVELVIAQAYARLGLSCAVWEAAVLLATFLTDGLPALPTRRILELGTRREDGAVERRVGSEARRDDM